jgi:hypothetical protein
MVFPEDLIPIFWNILEDKKVVQKWYRGPKEDNIRVYRQVSAFASAGSIVLSISINKT